jgi:hypothetical protein
MLTDMNDTIMTDSINMPTTSMARIKKRRKGKEVGKN